MSEAFTRGDMRSQVVDRVAELTGIPAGELLHLLGPGEIHEEWLHGGHNWSLTNHATTAPVQAAIERAIKEIRVLHPDAG